MRDDTPIKSHIHQLSSFLGVTEKKELCIKNDNLTPLLSHANKLKCMLLM